MVDWHSTPTSFLHFLQRWCSYIDIDSENDADIDIYIVQCYLSEFCPLQRPVSCSGRHAVSYDTRLVFKPTCKPNANLVLEKVPYRHYAYSCYSML
jgi:hypothetical protein